MTAGQTGGYSRQVERTKYYSNVLSTASWEYNWTATTLFKEREQSTEHQKPKHSTIKYTIKLHTVQYEYVTPRHNMDHMTASCRLLPQSRKWSDAHCRRSTWFCLHWRLICGCLVCILYCILCNAFRSPCWVNDQHTSAYNWSIVTGWSVPLPDQLCTDCGITVHTVYGVHICLIPRDSAGFHSHTEYFAVCTE